MPRMPYIEETEEDKKQQLRDELQKKALKSFLPDWLSTSETTDMDRVGLNAAEKMRENPSISPPRVTLRSQRESLSEPEARKDFVKKRLLASKGIAPSPQPKMDIKAAINKVPQEKRPQLEIMLSEYDTKIKGAEGRQNKMNLFSGLLSGIEQFATAEDNAYSGAKFDTNKYNYLRNEGSQRVKDTREDKKAFIKRKLAEKKLASDKHYKDENLAVKKKELEIYQGKANAANQPLTESQKMSKLSGEERKRYDSATMGLDAANDMDKALGDGTNTFSLVGDNDFTMAASRWEDAIGRMQSGGAINEEEGDRFRRMAPTVFDTADIQRKKLDWMKKEMNKRIKNLGFNSSQSTVVSPQDEEAYSWAMSNQEDPRAKAIIEKLTRKYQ